MGLNTFELGPIRPTCEGVSLLIRVTRGCVYNRYKFCNNYRRIRLSFGPLEKLKADIDKMADYRDQIKSHLEF